MHAKTAGTTVLIGWNVRVIELNIAWIGEATGLIIVWTVAVTELIIAWIDAATESMIVSTVARDVKNND
jgi:hypothetical protein